MQDRVIKQGSKERIGMFLFDVYSQKAQVRIEHGDIINGEFVAYPVQNPECYELVGQQFTDLYDAGFSENDVWKIINNIRSTALTNYNTED